MQLGQAVRQPSPHLSKVRGALSVDGDEERDEVEEALGRRVVPPALRHVNKQVYYLLHDPKIPLLDGRVSTILLLPDGRASTVLHGTRPNGFIP